METIGSSTITAVLCWYLLHLTRVQDVVLYRLYCLCDISGMPLYLFLGFYLILALVAVAFAFAVIGVATGNQFKPM